MAHSTIWQYFILVVSILSGSNELNVLFCEGWVVARCKVMVPPAYHKVRTTPNTQHWIVPCGSLSATMDSEMEFAPVVDTMANKTTTSTIRPGVSHTNASNSSPRPDIRIRPLTSDDQSFLWEILYQALYVAPGQEPPPRSIVYQPDLACYVAQWGTQVGDAGWVALDADNELVGALWLRFLIGSDNGPLMRGYGHVDDQTRELGLAVVPHQRGHGIGTALLQAVENETNLGPISLSVAVDNPCVRLYQRFGFTVVRATKESLILRRR